MNFNLSEEQELLKASVERFVRENYSLDQRRALVASADGYGPHHWRQMAELGWLGVSISEAHGGIGGGPVEVMVLMEAFGTGLVLEPFLSSIVLGGTLIGQAGTQVQKSSLLPALTAGELRLGFAYAEPQSGYDLFDVETKARRSGDSWILDGHKGVVLYAAAADKIVVSARSAGAARDRNGIGLFLVDATAPGLARRDYVTNDGQRASEVTLDHVVVTDDAVLGDPQDALGAIEHAAEHAIAALCAEAVGCMSVLVDTTNEYLKTREQFGRPIGRFQVLQHRMVDMFIALEEARSMTYLVTLKLDEEDAAERRRVASGAKMMIGRHGRFIGQQSVQLHGGMGMTEDMHVGHYFKRLTMVDVMLGDHRYHLKRYADVA